VDDALAAARFQATVELAEVGVEMMRLNLRRRFPDASDDEIEDRLLSWRRSGPAHMPGPLKPWPRTPAPHSQESQETQHL